MNKKKLIALCACAVLLLIAALAFGLSGNGETPTSPDALAEETTESGKLVQDESEASTQEAETKPTEAVRHDTQETMVTIPPENVQLGVVEGEHMSDIEEDDVADIPSGTTPVATTPSETKPAETAPSGGSALGEDFDFTTLTYESYNAMTGEQQKEVIDLFASPEEFMRWYKAAEAKYKEEHPDIEIGSDGSVDVGNLG